MQLSILARKVAFDYVNNIELNADFRRISSSAKAYLNNHSNWEEYAARWSQNKLSEDEINDSSDVFRWLNQREFASIALLNGTMHQLTFASFWGFSLIKEWELVEPFVRTLRNTEKGNDELFINFERLAKSEKFRALAKWDILSRKNSD